MRVIFITAVFTAVIVKDSTCLDNSGNLFMLSFIEPAHEEGKIFLAIRTNETTYVKVDIPYLGKVYEKNLSASTVWRMPLLTSVRYKSWPNIIQQGVKVTSVPAKVTVMVQDYGFYTTSGYMALPFAVLSTSYIAVTLHEYIFWGHSPVFLILGVLNSTTVTVRYKIHGGDCHGYNDGEQSTHTLNEHDVLGIQCSDDFTGTYIHSNNPIAVISGHPELKLTSETSGKDAVQEMLLPVRHFGQSYVLFELHAWGRGTLNRVVAAYDNTRVTTSDGDITELQAYEYITINTDVSGQRCLTSNRPVQVVAFAENSRSLSSIGDAFMAVLLPTNTFSDHVALKFPLADVVGVNEFLNVVIIADRRTVPAGQLDPMVTHNVIDGCYFDTYTQALNWPFSKDKGGFRFGAYIYGTYGQKYSGFGFPLIMDFDGDGCLLPCVNGMCTWSGTEYLCLCDVPFFGPQCTEQVLPSTMTPIIVRDETHNPFQGSGSLLKLAPSTQFPSTADTKFIPSSNDLFSNSRQSRSFILSSTSTSPLEPTTTYVSVSASSSFSSPVRQMSSAQPLLTSSNEAVTSTKVNGVFDVIKSSHSSEIRPSSKTIEFVSAPVAGADTNSMVFDDKISPSPNEAFPSITTLNTGPTSMSDAGLNVDVPEPSSAFLFETSVHREGETSSLTSPQTSFEKTFSRSTPTAKLSSLHTTDQTESTEGCGCFCFEQEHEELDEEKIQAIKEKYEKKLLVETRNLSKTIRKLTSAKDDRPSAVRVGHMGIMMLVLIGTLVFIPDIVGLMKGGSSGTAYSKNRI